MLFLKTYRSPLYERSLQGFKDRSRIRHEGRKERGLAATGNNNKKQIAACRCGFLGSGLRKEMDKVPTRGKGEAGGGKIKKQSTTRNMKGFS